MDTPRIFLAAPTYRPEPIRDVLCGAAPGCHVGTVSIADCPLERNFNLHWTAALNSRRECGWTDFAMIHSDVTPLDPHWLGWLARERRRVGADILAVVLRLRDETGLTSTALTRSGDPRAPRTRLTMKQVRRLPTTFDAADCGAAGLMPAYHTEHSVHWPRDILLVNTGLWICDFTRPWVEKAFFDSANYVWRHPHRSRWEVVCETEDWNFSRRAAENFRNPFAADSGVQGLHIYATTGLTADHGGYRNDELIGQEIDDEALALA